MSMSEHEIKALRKRLKLSQQKFATKLGVSLGTVSGWELGKHKPCPLALEKLEKIKGG